MITLAMKTMNLNKPQMLPANIAMKVIWNIKRRKLTVSKGQQVNTTKRNTSLTNSTKARMGRVLSSEDH